MRAEFFYRSPDAPRPNGPIGVGVQALIEREGTLLLGRRSDCGCRGLVGGGVGVEESLGTAPRREVFKETGLTVTDYELFCVFSDPSRIVSYQDGNVVRPVSFAFRSEVESFEPLRSSEESEELGFFPPGELEGLDIGETARPIVWRYQSGDCSPGTLMD